MTLTRQACFAVLAFMQFGHIPQRLALLLSFLRLAACCPLAPRSLSRRFLASARSRLEEPRRSSFSLSRTAHGWREISCLNFVLERRGRVLTGANISGLRHAACHITNQIARTRVARLRRSCPGWHSGSGTVSLVPCNLDGAGNGTESSDMASLGFPSGQMTTLATKPRPCLALSMTARIF